jgi:hypothetical protein
VELTTPEDPITAVLDMLAAHAERISQLDAHVSTVTDAAGRVREFAALAQLLDQRVTALGLRLDQIGALGRDGSQDWAAYTPAPPRRWWKLDGRDRDSALTALRAWVEQVYRPGYGQIAGTLGQCWDQHALCLYALDILAELWSVMYLADERPPSLLTAQAEYQARILPALAEQMAAETSRCRHRRDQLPGSGQQPRVS